MQEITFEIDAQRVGRASGYIGGLTVERYTFTGATIPAGTRLAILTRAGVTIAAAEITEGNAATVDTNTQEVADLLRYQPLGACESVYIALGNADNILAIIPATMRKNWLDDEATHPPVPANRYPTKTELDQWLARFDDRAAQTAAAQSAAQASATAARTSAANAEQSASAAGDSAVDAEDSATAADGSKRAAEAAQGNAEAAQRAAETAKAGAEASKEDAAQSATAAETAKADAQAAAAQAASRAEFALAAKTAAESAATVAQTAQCKAEAAQDAAQASAESAEAAKTAATQSATSAANSAQSAASSETAAANSATAAASSATAAESAKAGADAAKAAAASSATTAANSASQAKEYAESGSDALNERILRENVGISVAEYRVEVGDSPTEVSLVSAPKGALVVTNITHATYGYIYWLHDGTATKTTFARSALAMSGMFLLKWWEGDAVYMVYKGTDGSTKKATITFVNDEPNALEVQTLSDIDVTTITGARYCYVVGDFIVTSKGQVFNKNTLALIGSFTAPLYERFSPKDTSGYFLFITDNGSRYRASRVKVQEDGSPLFETYSDLATVSNPTPLMVGMMNILCMGFIGNNHVRSDDWISETYANGLYRVDNTGGNATTALPAECLPFIYIPKNLYIGGLSLTFISAQKNFPIIRQVWRSALGEVGRYTYQRNNRYYNTTSVTTRTGDGKYYFVYSLFNARPCLFVQELTEVK